MTPGQVRGATAPGGVRGLSQQQSSSPAVRAVRPLRSSVSTPPQRAGLRPRAATPPVRTPGTKTGAAATAAATPPSRAGGVRQQSPAVRPQATSQTKPQTARYTEVPTFLKSLIKFPSKVETNTGG